MPRVKGLTETGVNLYQLPAELEMVYQADLSGRDVVSPVRPKKQKFIPMTLDIIPPKIKPNLQRIQEQNLALTQSQNDKGFRGTSLLSSDSLFEQAQQYDLSIQTMAFVPPLVLYINPTTWSVNRARKYNQQFAGMGQIIEHWGEEQIKLSASGKIGGTYTDKTGLTRYFRRDTASYQSLMHLYVLYRNNGMIYESLDKSRIGVVGYVRIVYDSEIWIGHFDSFSMSEDASNPYTMDYSFDFTVSEHFNDTSIG